MNKKSIIISVIVGILILILGSILYLNQNSKDNTQIPKETSQVNEEDQALLHKEEGEVFYTIPNETETQLEESDTYIPSGTKVRTGEGIAVVVFLDDSVMTLDYDTEVEITYSPNKISVLQSIGNTWHRVTSLISSNASYEVDTPSALATVRGTIFGIRVTEDGETDIIVDESLVDVSQHTEDGLEFIVQLQTKQGLFVTKAKVSPEMLRQLQEEDFKNDWLLRNKKLDNQWLDLKAREIPPREMLEKINPDGELAALRKILGELDPNNPLDKQELDLKEELKACQPTCQEGFKCENINQTPKCVPLEEAKQTTCEPSCAKGYFCDLQSLSCKKEPQTTCEPACEKGYTCNTLDFTCRQAYCYPQCEIGYSCDTSNFTCKQTSCIPSCSANQYCDKSGIIPTCKDFASSGGTTTTETTTTCNPSCSAGYICNTSSLDCDPIPGYCNSTADCPSGKLCSANSCIYGPTSCSSTAECGNGLECIDMVCMTPPPSCSVDSDCGPTELCNPSTNTCEYNPSSCTSTSECPFGEICELYACTYGPTSCSTTAECGNGLECIDSTCIDPAYVSNYCNPLTGPMCNTGEICQDNTCIPDPNICFPACTTGQICESGTCVTDPLYDPVGSCTITSDCGLNEVCLSNSCVTGDCSIGCGNGYFCDTLDNTCLPSS